MSPARRLVAAMSGGVDSAVAAARAVDAGHDVVGVHMALSPNAAALRESARGCCTIEDAGDARRVADRLGIPFYVWDFAQAFRRDVVDDFVAEYAAGRTPNPCLRCNERIKFSALLDRALALGFDGVVTGHYARVVEAGESASGERELHRAVDAAKDQSYVLGVLDTAQLAGAYFPLGDSLKTHVRDEAAARGFSVAKKPDSYDICFIPDGDTRGFLGGQLVREPGEIQTVGGEVVGQHDGAVGYTVGQRKGLGLSRPSPDGAPRYVVGVDVERNVVLVGEQDLLGVSRIEASHVRWLTGDSALTTLRSTGALLGVQLRAHGVQLPAEVSVTGGLDSTEALVILLAERARGVAAGQSVVLYDGTRVVGSGTITAAGR